MLVAEEPVPHAMTPNQTAWRSRGAPAVMASSAMVHVYHSGAKRLFALAQRSWAAERSWAGQPGRHSDRSEAKRRNLQVPSDEISRLPAVARNDECPGSDL